MQEKELLHIVNQIFEIETKLQELDLVEKFERNFIRMKNVFENNGLTIINPLNEKYTESRTDCEANIVGSEKGNLIITKVLKPAVYKKTNDQMQLIQKAIVLVEKK